MDWKTYDKPEDLEAAVNAYFDQCDANGQLYGEAGLALGLNIALETLRSWYDGNDRPELQPVIQRAYLRIQDQIECGPVYLEKNMLSRATFLLKQRRLGGYQDRPDTGKHPVRLQIKMGQNTNASDFE